MISGSADIGAGVGAAGVMRAFSKGAPVRILAPAFTGTGDLYWYVKADSKIQSLKDTTPETTIAYSTNGSSSNNIVVAFVSELGAKAKPTATGGPAATLTAVMSGQVDAGWAAPPFAMEALRKGEIRMIVKSSELPLIKGHTIRVLIANKASLDSKPDVYRRFMRAYRETIDWMYATDEALKVYADFVGIPLEDARTIREEFDPKEMLIPDRVLGLSELVPEAIKFKFITQPLSAAQLTELVQIPK